jgi:hypothetical protein
MSKDALSNVLGWVVGINDGEAADDVKRLRAKYPTATNENLARRIFATARTKATSVGVLTGLPANPWVMLPAAIADLATVLRIETEAVARVALLYDPSFFEQPDAAWELLVPVFGIDALSQFLRDLGVLGSMGVTRQLVRQYLSKETLRSFQKVMLKYFGMKVTQKGVLSKSLPIVGSVIGGGWNFAEVTILTKRTIAYFQNRSISTGADVQPTSPP